MNDRFRNTRSENSGKLLIAPLNGGLQATIATIATLAICGIGFPNYTAGGEVFNIPWTPNFGYPMSICDNDITSVTIDVNMGGNQQYASFIINVFAN